MDIDAPPKTPPGGSHIEDVAMQDVPAPEGPAAKNARPVQSEDEDATRPVSEEESPVKQPRRSTRRKTAARKRAQAEVEDLDVDNMFSGPGIAGRSGVLQYLRESKRLDGEVATSNFVEEIIAQNRLLNDIPGSRQRSTADELVDEIASAPDLQRTLASYCTVTRESLISRIGESSAEVTAKAQRLRSQYRLLNKEWTVMCAELDKQAASEKELKTPIPATPTIETPTFGAAGAFTTTRATRRSAGNALMADAVRSEAEFEQIMATLGNEDLVDPNILSIRNAASIPDMLSVVPRSAPMLEVIYDDLNGRVAHPEQFYDISLCLGDWSEKEKTIFMDQFAIFGKQFGKIAEHLEHKTAEQCVLFYYISKRSIVNFREVVSRGVRGRRKRMAKRNVGGVGKQKGNALLTDIRTRMEDATPMDSPMGSPKQADVEVPSRRRGRPAEVGTPATEDTGRRTTRSTRQRRGPSPGSSGETPARESPEDNSSSDNDSDGQTTEDRRPKTRRARKPVQVPESTTNGTVAAKRKSRASSHWSTAEKATFKEQLAIHGKNYEAIAAVVKTKSATQCRNFFHSNHKDMELDKIVEEWEAKQQVEGTASSNEVLRVEERDYAESARSSAREPAGSGANTAAVSYTQICNC